MGIEGVDTEEIFDYAIVKSKKRKEYKEYN